MTNSGRASTFAATDAATPTLRRIERAAIAAATPITYYSTYLLLSSIVQYHASIVCPSIQLVVSLLWILFSHCVCSSDLKIQGTSTLNS